MRTSESRVQRPQATRPTAEKIDKWLERAERSLQLGESRLLMLQENLFELGAEQVEDVLVLAGTLQELEELELGCVGPELDRLWEAVKKAKEEEDAWLAQEAKDATRRQQEEEEARVRTLAWRWFLRVLRDPTDAWG